MVVKKQKNALDMLNVLGMFDFINASIIFFFDFIITQFIRVLFHQFVKLSSNVF